MGRYGWEDCPEPNRRQIERLKDELLEHLGSNLAGIYLHGSLALNSFHPGVSDIDVVVLLHDSIGVDQRFELVKVFLGLSNDPAPLEISLITQSAVRPWQYPTPFQLHSSEYWRASYEEQVRRHNKEYWAETSTDSDLACHITLIRHKGICLYGTPIREAFPAVPEQDFRSSILSDVQYAANALNTLPTYGILTLCRILSYLKTGRILSKSEAGEWALSWIPQHLRLVVARAIDLYSGAVRETAHFDERELELFKNFMLSAIDGYIFK